MRHGNLCSFFPPVGLLQIRQRTGLIFKYGAESSTFPSTLFQESGAQVTETPDSWKSPLYGNLKCRAKARTSSPIIQASEMLL